MQSKFIDILAYMGSEEKKRLLQFLRSPYFNSESTVLKLGEFLIHSKAKEDYNPIQLSQITFGSRAIEPVALRVVLSKLYKLMVRFFNAEYSLSHVHWDMKGSIRYFRGKKTEKYFYESLVKAKESIEENSLRNESYYDARYSQIQEEYEYLKVQKRQGEFMSQDLLNAIEMSYLIKKLRYCTRIITIQSINRMDIEFPFLNSILLHVEKEKLYEHSVLGFYFFTYQSQLNPESDELFDKAYKILQTSEEQFEYDELKDNYLTTINYCIRKVNRGNEMYNEILFNLYNKALNRGFLSENNVLSRFTYRNISETALKLGRYEWVDLFLQQYKDKLEKKYRRSFYELQLARYYSCISQYEQALELLSSLSFEDPLIELANRLERIKIFVEIKNFELADYLLQAKKVYLRRHKNLGYHYEHYKNFVFYTEKLVQGKYDKIIFEKLKSETKVTEKKWILSKFKLN